MNVKDLKSICSALMNIFLQATLDAVMKEKTFEEMGVFKHAENLTVDEETQLWEKGVINKFTPKG